MFYLLKLWDRLHLWISDKVELGKKLRSFALKSIRRKAADEVLALIENIDVNDLVSAQPACVIFFCWTKLNLHIYLRGYRIVSLDHLPEQAAVS